MKRISIKRAKLVFSFFVLTTIIMGCKNDDYPEKTIAPENAISQRYFSFMTASLNNGGFFNNEKPNSEVVYVIDSQKELVDKYTGTSSLPDFPLNSYTLIVGRVNMPSDGSYVLTRHNITKSDTKGVLNLYFKKSSGSYSDVKNYDFWGLYPKLNVRTITINKIIE
ncbi:MAG: hypothetical protein IJL29_10085 [Prevotella sp.]|nr:hypothetical protein [Prevotella sp.]